MCFVSWCCATVSHCACVRTALYFIVLKVFVLCVQVSRMVRVLSNRIISRSVLFVFDYVMTSKLVCYCVFECSAYSNAICSVFSRSAFLVCLATVRSEVHCVSAFGYNVFHRSVC